MSEMTDFFPATSEADHPEPTGAHQRLKRTMTYLFVIYLAWLLIGCSVQRSILFPRSLAESPGSVRIPPNVQVWTIESAQGPVEAWFILGDGVSAQAPGPVVIFAHGNAELIDHWPDGLSGYTRLGVSVLLPEFRGYGRSSGKPSQLAIAEDYAMFYDKLTARPEVDPSRVVLHGRSIGGGIASQLAADRPSAALILQSSPSSIKRMAARFLIPWFLVRDPFDSLRVVRAYNQPVLVMHGTADRIIPPSHASRLANAATHPVSKLILYDVDHNTLPPNKPYWDDIEQFLKDAEVLR